MGTVNSDTTVVSYGQSPREEKALGNFTQTTCGISRPVPPRGAGEEGRDCHSEGQAPLIILVGGRWVGGPPLLSSLLYPSPSTLSCLPF